jgi:Cd2+/Zn2+-exporting ATPase
MKCANCARTVESGVGRLPGVTASSLNFTTGTLTVQGEIAPEAIFARVHELGYEAAPLSSVVRPQRGAPAPEAAGSLLSYLMGRRDTRLALLGILLILPGLLFEELLPGLGIHSRWFDVAAVAAMVLAGVPIAQSAWRSLWFNREITINFLMTIAAIGAVVIGAYTEAGLVMVLFAIGEALDGYTAARARDAIRSLSAVAPAEASLLVRVRSDGFSRQATEGRSTTEVVTTNDSTNDWGETRVPIEDLRVGDRILVRPGERIAMDGRILSGFSSVNQAPITGESRPVDKQPGDEVLASTINGQGALEIEVTHLAADNTISRLIQMVAEAQDRRANAQRFVDRFARIYTPAVVAVAFLVAVIPPLLWGVPFWGEGAWLYRGLALLVVACPCALVISTPVSIISAISNGTRHGILFKGGAFLEALSRTRAIVFDKTGTLTRGEPAVVAVNAADCLNPPNGICLACDDLVAIASAVEQHSEHPLAQAILNEATLRGVHGRYPAGQNVTALAGKGVTGSVNGQAITVANHAYFDFNQRLAHDCAVIDSAAGQGYTTMLVGDEGRYRGYITVADTLRPGSREAVESLRSQGVEALIMLTGDNEATAERIAGQVGLDEVQANCLPGDKMAAVGTYREQYEHVAMVGDGINDAPALATASVGVAIGRTAQAMETADIVLLGDDLRQLPFALKLSRAAMATVRANVILSIGIKLAFLALVLFGLGSMWLAVLADVGTSLLVTLNGMRLLRRPSWDIGLPEVKTARLKSYAP